MDYRKTGASKLPIPTLRAMRLSCDGRKLGAAAFCDCCEALHHHDELGEFAGDVHAPQCSSGPASPYAATGYKLDLLGDVADPRDALPRAPFRGLAWQRFQTHSRRLQSHTAATLFGRVKALSAESIAFRTGVFAGKRFDLAFTHWAVEGVARGRDLLSAAVWLFGITPGVAAVRILEAATGSEFDAQAFLEIAAAVDDWRARGAKRGEGRRA